MTVDCAALPENLLESELFGHAKGAFTGAQTARVGAIESAEGGTVFLDEIGELSPSMQPKLLRVLESRSVRRIGESTYRKIDVRFISATHRDLRTMINTGAFREDLYFRIAVIPLVLPPLRERPEDIAALVRHFVPQGDATRLGPDVIAEIVGRPWLGNVRELRNFVERAVVLGPREALAMTSSAAAPAASEWSRSRVGVRSAARRGARLLAGAARARVHTTPAREARAQRSVRGAGGGGGPDVHLSADQEARALAHGHAETIFSSHEPPPPHVVEQLAPTAHSRTTSKHEPPPPQSIAKPVACPQPKVSSRARPSAAASDRTIHPGRAIDPAVAAAVGTALDRTSAPRAPFVANAWAARRRGRGTMPQLVVGGGGEASGMGRAASAVMGAASAVTGEASGSTGAASGTCAAS